MTTESRLAKLEELVARLEADNLLLLSRIPVQDDGKKGVIELRADRRIELHAPELELHGLHPFSCELDAGVAGLPENALYRTNAGYVRIVRGPDRPSDAAFRATYAKF